MEGSFRYTNRDFIFNESTNKCRLEFEVESIDSTPSDQTLIVLAIDALAGLIEDNSADPKIIFDEVLKMRTQH